MLSIVQGKARACAIEVRLQAHEVETVLANPPPQVQLDPNSIIAAQWFNKHWLIAHSQGECVQHSSSFTTIVLRQRCHTSHAIRSRCNCAFG